jgi:hypothetical protein
LTEGWGIMLFLILNLLVTSATQTHPQGPARLTFANCSFLFFFDFTSSTHPAIHPNAIKQSIDIKCFSQFKKSCSHSAQELSNICEP